MVKTLELILSYSFPDIVINKIPMDLVYKNKELLIGVAKILIDEDEIYKTKIIDEDFLEIGDSLSGFTFPIIEILSLYKQLIKRSKKISYTNIIKKDKRHLKFVKWYQYIKTYKIDILYIERRELSGFINFYKQYNN